jgi:hypothetical protein
VVLMEWVRRPRAEPVQQARRPKVARAPQAERMQWSLRS